jgi:hypothetical protein
MHPAMVSQLDLTDAPAGSDQTLPMIEAAGIADSGNAQLSGSVVTTPRLDALSVQCGPIVRGIFRARPVVLGYCTLTASTSMGRVLAQPALDGPANIVAAESGDITT